MSRILPKTKTNGLDGERIPCEAPVHLTSISTESIRWTRLSPDGNYLAFSTLNKLRVYRIDTQDFNVQVNKVSNMTHMMSHGDDSFILVGSFNTIR